MLYAVLQLYSATPFQIASVTYVALIQESMPDYYLGMRKRSRAAFLALFMWVGLGCLLAHSYRFFNI